MTETIQKIDKNNDQCLFEDLERRYGPAMAQEIIDQLKKAEKHQNKANASIPDYLGVKAMSEAEEIYRHEAGTALKRLKTYRSKTNISSKNILEFDGALLQREFERSFSFYLRFNRGYHVLYRQAIEAYKVKAYNPYKQTTTAMAA